MLGLLATRSVYVGYLNTVMDEATEAVKRHYGDAFFRTRAGIAQPKGTGKGDGKDDETDHCKGGKFTATSKECCPHWNLRKPHPPGVVTENGVCKKNHVCDAFVSDKGPGGKCMGNHRRMDCDNPARRSSPLQ